MAFFDLNELVILDPITGDVIDDSVTDVLVEESVSADVVNACDALDGVVGESISAVVVTACDGLARMVEESVSAVVVNSSDSSDGLVNYVSSSTDVVPVSNAIEVHVARVCTRSLFVRVQKEIIAGSWLCSIKIKSSDEGCDICIIKEENVIPDSMPDPDEINKAEDSDDDVEEIILYEKATREYKVLHNRSDDSVVCCCQLFVRCGILCRHVFCVFKNCNVQKIPNQYLLRRWTRDLIPPGLRRKKNRYGKKNENVANLVVQATSLVDDCFNKKNTSSGTKQRVSGYSDIVRNICLVR
ncbi:FAR1 DNA binding domain, Zinc finger, SWIM-type, MULE transposase domain, FHY3/FAR1 family [Artemisia annua]|uniref:FAR1 DNA binding domain, Zinc finger, SWIM-type, MULE transposase domain, FHY3/FAR1 family n=1 Tax=Artemisia annua TaxID=35608 RepID=A0A2U1PNU2_ARTAN|nr:FAR1 DNA binding domain, Zinc finger, SWIM-type, MULE transposase domain, FHY3/FAR1 family [Artemisia annua]